MGIATLGVISSSTLLAPSANAFTIGSIGSNTLSAGSVTFSDFSTTTTNPNWLNYAINASIVDGPEPKGLQFTIATGPVTVGAGSYNITYKVTKTGLPIGGVFVNQSSAFSDYHGTGGNPAANASYADSAFVANRFRVVQRRYHV